MLWEIHEPIVIVPVISHPHVKSGSDEGYWAEMSAIYINHQHLRGFYTKENHCGNARFDHTIDHS